MTEPAIAADRSIHRARNVTRVIVFALVVITILLVGYSVDDLLVKPRPLVALLVGWTGLVVATGLYAYVVRAALLGREDSAWVRAAVAVDTVILFALLAFISIGWGWLQVPLFGLVGALLVFRGRWRIAVSATIVVVYGVLSAPLLTSLQWLANTATWLLVSAIVVGLVWLVRSARERTERAVAAVCGERLRMARDLHDSLGHSLSVVLLKLELAERLHDRDVERSAHEVGEARALLRSAVEEMDELVTGMRVRSLREEIDNACAVLSAAGVRTRTGGPDVTARTVTTDALGWVVREGVTNILRHARAVRCEITVGRADGHLQVTMVNDGARDASAGAGSGGHGLDGLRERLDGVGGTLATGSNGDDEFVLTARVPLEAT